MIYCKLHASMSIHELFDKLQYCNLKRICTLSNLKDEIYDLIDEHIWYESGEIRDLEIEEDCSELIIQQWLDANDYEVFIEEIPDEYELRFFNLKLEDIQQYIIDLQDDDENKNNEA